MCLSPCSFNLARFFTILLGTVDSVGDVCQVEEEVGKYGRGHDSLGPSGRVESGQQAEDEKEVGDECGYCRPAYQDIFLPAVAM
jgi:hypothetical protein